LTDDGRVFANLIAQLLVHAHNHGVRRLDIAEGRLKTLAHLRRAFDPPARRGRDHAGFQKNASNSISSKKTRSIAPSGRISTIIPRRKG